MREFSTSIREGLFNGLVPKKAPDGSQFLSSCINLVRYGSYFGSYKPVNDIVEAEKDFPFPQWLRLDDIDLFITRNDVQVISGGTLTSITKGVWAPQEFTEPFRGVSYGSYWFITNRDASIWFDGEEMHKTEDFRAATIIRDRNRTVFGGALDGFWTPTWKALLDSFGSAEIAHENRVDSNFVFWSSFGSHDFPFSLVDPSIVPNTKWLVDSMKHNEWGFMELGFRGSVLDFHVFQESLVALGEDGISFLRPDLDLPGSSYGEVDLINVGLKCRGAVAGDALTMVFIDNENRLWRMTRETRDVVDFSDYFSQLGEDTYVTKDPHEDIYYIGDGATSYVLSGLALFQVWQTIGYVSPGYEAKTGVTFPTAPQNAVIQSDTHDLFQHSQKTLVGVAVVATEQVGGTAQVESEVRGVTYTSPQMPLNFEGYAALRLFGRGHKISLEFPSYENKNIRVIELKWQLDDVRYRRGASGLENAGRAGSAELE